MKNNKLIWYRFESKNKKKYPDFFLQSENKMLEWLKKHNIKYERINEKIFKEI